MPQESWSETPQAQNLLSKFYRCSFFSPTRMERPLEMSALGMVQSSPPHTPLVLWFYIAAWTGGRGNCSQQKGVLFPVLSACLGIGFHLGDVMKEILQQKQLLHPSFGSVLPIPALCRGQTISCCFPHDFFCTGNGIFGASSAFLLPAWWL